MVVDACWICWPNILDEFISEIHLNNSKDAENTHAGIKQAAHLWSYFLMYTALPLEITCIAWVGFRRMTHSSIWQVIFKMTGFLGFHRWIVSRSLQKLEVVQYCRQLKEKKEEAKNVLRAPRTRGGTRAQKKKAHEERKEAQQVCRVNYQKACEEKFGSIVGGAQVCKWDKMCTLESWEEIPEIVRTWDLSDHNAWRTKLGLAKKGAKKGGKVPHSLQVEVDRLVAEMVSGASSVPCRKEAVTFECLVSWLKQCSALSKHGSGIAVCSY